MLFWLDQTSPKAWLCHFPSLWAFWMIHIGPWDWEWTTDHVMETFLHMQSWHALTCMRSGVEGVALPLTLLEDGALPAKTLQLYLFSLQFHISSPLPWHLPPKKPVSRSGQLTAPAQAPSQKGDLGIVVGVWMLSGRAGVNLWCKREVWYYLLHKFLLPPPLLSKFLNTEKLRLNVQFISRNVNVNLNI